MRAAQPVLFQTIRFQQKDSLMPLIYQNTDIIGTGDAVTTSTTPAMVNGDQFILAEDTVIVSTTADGFDPATGNITDYDFTILGDVFAEDSAVDLNGFDASIDVDFSLYLGAEGSLRSQFGFTLYMGWDGAGSTGRIDVRNDGLIHGVGDGAVLMFGVPDLSLRNSGTISTQSEDGFNFDSAVTFSSIQGTARIVNSGLIENNAMTASMSAFDIEDVAAISLRSQFADRDTNFARIVNTGTVSSRQWSIYAEAGEIQIVNSGLLDGSIFIDQDSSSNTSLFRNAGGQLLGDYVGGNGVDTVLNTGLITGDVNLGGGADIYRGFGGTVTGTINGGAGGDTFFVDQVGVVIDGGADYDTVFTRADFVSGGGIESIVLQGAGDIDATGDTEANLMLGNKGDNELIGLTGNDTLLGGDGDDILMGGGNLDALRGGRGDDILVGGGGKDIQFGGLGADVFKFEAITDSGLLSTNRDVIQDFEIGVDLIDLSELTTAVFSFQGTGGLSGTGPSLTYAVTALGDALVRIDVDGDGTQDMQIVVANTGLLTADDFLL